MTTGQPISTIQQVSLRTAWPDEARNFTPWLAENISELGKALGMELELQATEAPVGNYSLDILATDLNENRPVIIENQLEPTNHDHLGKLLTYAAGLDANVVVWLTREFREEHRQALDWLNGRTRENTEFFGVVVELWKIEDSKPAPHFNLVVTPNGWRKQAGPPIGPGPNMVSPTNQRYRIFFQELIDTLREDHQFTNARKGQPQNWYSFTTGVRAGLQYGANFAKDEVARTEIYIDMGNRDNNIRLFERLEEHREEIEEEFGQALSWQRLEGRRACRIAAERQGYIAQDEDTLAEIRSWMVERLLAFRKTFDPHLRREVER